MPNNTLTPAGVLSGQSPLVLTAKFEPIGSDRFQPAGFPEIGHVIYKAPRKNGTTENVCIVDSAASMANHLESVCMRGPHDFELVEDLKGMPYIRCVTGDLVNGTLPRDKCEVVVTSLTEGHRIASSYFLEGTLLSKLSELAKAREAKEEAEKLKKDAKKLKKEKDKSDEKQAEAEAKEKEAEKKEKEAEKLEKDAKFQSQLAKDFGIALPGSKNLPADKWWDVFKTIFKLDPNSLVHGVLFPKWQIKIPRALTAHLEAFGASRVDRSGVKFDRLGKTTSGQPIFAVDDVTAGSIRATFVLDVSLIRSFGRTKEEDGNKTQLGLTEDQKAFLVALALWKIQKLTQGCFRFRSGCHLECKTLESCGQEVKIDVDITKAINEAGFPQPPVMDVFWPREELYREGASDANAAGTSEGDEDGSPDEEDGGTEES